MILMINLLTVIERLPLNIETNIKIKIMKTIEMEFLNEIIPDLSKTYFRHNQWTDLSLKLKLRI